MHIWIMLSGPGTNARSQFFVLKFYRESGYNTSL